MLEGLWTAIAVAIVMTFLWVRMIFAHSRLRKASAATCAHLADRIQFQNLKARRDVVLQVIVVAMNSDPLVQAFFTDLCAHDRDLARRMIEVLVTEVQSAVSVQ